MVSYKIFIFIMMVLLHILEDFHLQGILANMKQRDWWYKEYCKERHLGEGWSTCKYKKDYVVCLIMHSLENSIFIMLPIIIDGVITILTVNPNNSYFIMWIGFIFINTILHALIDNAKCNGRSINLITDQAMHFVIMAILFAESWKYLGAWR